MFSACPGLLLFVLDIQSLSVLDSPKAVTTGHGPGLMTAMQGLVSTPELGIPKPVNGGTRGSATYPWIPAARSRCIRKGHLALLRWPRSAKQEVTMNEPQPVDQRAELTDALAELLERMQTIGSQPGVIGAARAPWVRLRNLLQLDVWHTKDEAKVRIDSCIDQIIAAPPAEIPKFFRKQAD